MKREPLNNKAVFEKFILNAQMENDCTTLARTLFMILENNPDLIINFKANTMDEMVFEKLKKAVGDILDDEQFNDKWSSISGGVYELILLKNAKL